MRELALLGSKTTGICHSSNIMPIHSNLRPHTPLRVLQISAKKGTGVDELLETVALVAEVEQLMSNPDRAAAGTVLEAHLDKRVGAIATLLVQTGTLHIGDVVVAGSAYGKVMHLKPFSVSWCCQEAENCVSWCTVP